MSKIKQCMFNMAMLMVACLGAPCQGRVVRFNQYIGFGDSTLDSGYFRYNSTGVASIDSLVAAAVASGDTGAFVANGKMNCIILANKFCLSAAPVGAPGGTNYANGASYTATNRQPLPGSVSVLAQIQNYLTSVGGVANPHALYVIKSGDNDLHYNSPGPLPPDYLKNSASALATKAAMLQSAGACTIMVPNSYNSAVFAGLGGDIDPSNAAKYATSEKYGLLRWADLCAAGVHFIPADIGSVFAYVVHHPALFGFTPPCVLANNGPAMKNPAPYNSALLAYPFTTEQMKTFLFVDNKHLTTAGQTIEADYEYSLLVAPSQVSLVMDSAIQNGLATAATIQRQIDLLWQPCQRAAHFWVAADAKYERFKNTVGFPCASGVPFGGTIGVDYQLSCRAVLGAALELESQRQKFSQIGGCLRQIVEAPSLYVAYNAGNVWGDAVVTYRAFQNTINRRVPLGMFTDENRAHPAGRGVALMIGVGGDFKPGCVTTGPVAYVVLQRAHLHGFTENGTSGVTALSFAGSRWHSLVSQFGWRVLADMGKWQPFVQARWNHEWGGRCNAVTTSLTTISAPAYTVNAAPQAANWGDAWVGISCQPNSRVAVRGAFLATFCSRRVTTYGGELGLNVSF